MAQTLLIRANQLNPWTPDIDSRRSDKPGIISGTNFIDDVDGPRSAFASAFFDYNFFDASTRSKVVELPTANGYLYGTPTGVWKINDTSKALECILSIEVDVEFWPWTIAYVGGKYYLAQYDVGLWEYDPVANTVTHIDTPAGDSVRYVAENSGRLIYITPDKVAISALDDGRNLTPSLTTGAGAQDLSIVGGTAYRIASLPDGFLVYMSQGILRATFVQAAYVFTYKRLTGAIKVFSPNCGVYIPGIGDVVLDASGFWLAKDTKAEPEAWEEEKGDYIKKNIISFLNQNLFGIISMYYSIAERKLFVSFSENLTEGSMQTTFVYTIISQRWSSFNVSHHGIFETLSVSNNIRYCSYMDINGYFKYFTNFDFTYDIPESPYIILDLTYRITWVEMQVQDFTNDADVEYQRGFTDILFSDNIPTAYNNYAGFGLFYINFTPYSDTSNDSSADPPYDPFLEVGRTYINFDTSGGTEITAIPYQLPKIGLNSVITVGPFRYTEQTHSDQTSNIESLILGLSATSSFIITEDWNLLSGTEDWNTLSGTEDWGSGIATPNSFDLVLVDTDDGINPPIQGEEFLPVFKDQGSTLVYNPTGFSSIYHTLTLKALDPNEAFALKFVDITGQLTGRLSFS